MAKVEPSPARTLTGSMTTMIVTSKLATGKCDLKSSFEGIKVHTRLCRWKSAFEWINRHHDKCREYKKSERQLSFVRQLSYACMVYMTGKWDVPGSPFKPEQTGRTNKFKIILKNNGKKSCLLRQ